MLSYMVPSIEDKPPPAPTKTRFQLDLENPRLTNGHALVNGTDMLVTASERAVRPGAAKTAAAAAASTTISAESSASSLSSGVADLAPTHLDKPKPKLISNGGAKHQSLKRVSFGSSKGSMVETLIYESPVQEEPEPPSPVAPSDPNDPDALSQSEVKHPSRVRVTFFEQDRPLVVSSPEPDAHDDLLDAVCAVMTMTMTASPAEPNGAPYSRQTSTDSGWDNPFRPDGDLSREADEIVELIKGGKPITPTPGEPTVTDSVVTPAEAAPASGPRNGRATGAAPAPAPASKPASPGAVELQRATVAPSDASQVEHVVLKKKPKCKCCVIQ